MCGSRQVVWLLGHVCWQVCGRARPFSMLAGQLSFFNVGRHVAWPMEFNIVKHS